MSIEYHQASPIWVPKMLLLIRELATVQGMEAELTENAEGISQMLVLGALFGWVATHREASHRVVGCALCHFDEPSTFSGRFNLKLHDLIVTNDYRKLGIGQDLLTFVARWSNDLGVNLKLEVLDGNPALGFYKRLGGEVYKDPLVDDGRRVWNQVVLKSAALRRIGSREILHS